MSVAYVTEATNYWQKIGRSIPMHKVLKGEDYLEL